MTLVFAHTTSLRIVDHWTWEPITIAVLVVSAWLYARGVAALWRRAGSGEGIHKWEVTAFGLGLLSIAVALLSPLAWLSTLLFSAHMTQHEMLMLISAPLLVFGRPLLVMLWAFAPASRERIAHWTRRRDVTSVWRTATAPVSVFFLHGLALWIWHNPAWYEAALANEGIHALQHLSFLVTAALFWWGMVHGRYGRRGYGAAVLYVFLTAVHSSLLGALLTVAPQVWYPSYLNSITEWKVDALVDQQLAGLLMWVPSGVIFIVLGLAMLAAWIGESERRAKLGCVSPP